MNAPTDWGSAIAILAAGLIAGALLIYFFTRKKTATLDANLDRKDLEAKRDALIADLRALPDDAIDERARLERETANVLRELDTQSPLPAPRGEGGREQRPGEGRPPSTTMNPAIKGFLWGATSFAALGALGYFVMQSATPREPEPSAMSAQQPGNPATQQPDPMVQQLEAQVQKDPNNLALRNDLAQAYLDRDNLMGVFEQSKFVLDKNPNDTRALTMGAVVRMAMGEADAAMSMLQQATKADPNNLDGWVAMAWIYSQTDRMKDAEASIAQAIKASPADKAKLEQVLQQMKQHAQQPPPAQQASAAGAGEMPPGHPPIAGAEPAMAMPPAAAPAAAAGGQNVRVTLELDASAKSKSGIVYVMARPPAGGPPVAVRRLMVQSFPVTIDFGASDSMMGQPLPPTFRLEARLDSDGDAATKSPADPQAMQDGVAPGAVVKLALK